MKYKTFLNLLLLITLIFTVIIMTTDNVEATSSNYFLNVEIEVLLTWVNYISANDGFTYVNINDVRVLTIHCLTEHGWDPHFYVLAAAPTEIHTFILNFSVPYRIDNITLDGVNGYDVYDIGCHVFPYHITHLNASFRIYKNNTLITSGHGLGTHILNLPCPSVPLPPPIFELPPPIFELPPSPNLTPPATRPIFFNFTILIPFFNFVDALFLPFAQIIMDILWIFLSILDFISNILITFWTFYDNHVLLYYEGLFNILGFTYMFFEIPEIMTIMIFGLILIVIKIYLKR